MTTKPGAPRRRQNGDAAELKAWRMVFDTGEDFVARLKAIGIKADGSAEFLAVARLAWFRLGPLAWRKFEFKRKQLEEDGTSWSDWWALKTFGPPPGMNWQEFDVDLPDDATVADYTADFRRRLAAQWAEDCEVSIERAEELVLWHLDGVMPSVRGDGPT